MSRKSSSLDVLLRLKRHEIHEIAREIADLTAAIQDHSSTKAEIEKTRHDRADPTFPEAAAFTANFLKHTNELLRRQARQLERMEENAKEVSARLRDAFIETKQIDLTIDRRAADQRAEQSRLEESEMDETTTTAFSAP